MNPPLQAPGNDDLTVVNFIRGQDFDLPLKAPVPRMTSKTAATRLSSFIGTSQVDAFGTRTVTLRRRCDSHLFKGGHSGAGAPD